MRKAVTLGFCGEVDACFFESIAGRAKDDVRKFPEAEKPRNGLVSSGEEDVGVEEEPVHEAALFRATMGDGVRVEAELFDFAASAIVIGTGGGVVQQEFGFAFGRVLFNGDDQGGPKQDTVVARFGGDEGAFLQAKAAAKLCGNDDCAAFADSGGIHRKGSFQNV